MGVPININALLGWLAAGESTLAFLFCINGEKCLDILFI
jgi:hypothetical protein